MAVELRGRYAHQNLNSGSIAIAHENLDKSVLGKGLWMGTSCRLHQATWLGLGLESVVRVSGQGQGWGQGQG